MRKIELEEIFIGLARNEQAGFVLDISHRILTVDPVIQMLERLIDKQRMAFLLFHFFGRQRIQQAEVDIHRLEFIG
jgi:hypothetical protein